MTRHSCIESLLERKILYKLEAGGMDINPLEYMMRNLTDKSTPQNLYYFVLTQQELDAMIIGEIEKVDE